MSAIRYTAPLKLALLYFSRTISVFKEEDSGFAPTPGQFTVAQHVAHVAQTIDWFIEGAFRPEGFDMDFGAQHAAVREVGSFAQSVALLAKAVDDAAAVLDGKSDEEMMQPLPAGPIMGGQPRAAIVAAISEHTAHHRGALAVYARLLGYSPPMPYMD